MIDSQRVAALVEKQFENAGFAPISPEFAGRVPADKDRRAEQAGNPVSGHANKTIGIDCRLLGAFGRFDIALGGI